MAMHRYVELAIVVAGIYALFLSWGVAQERVTTSDYAGKRFRYFMCVFPQPGVRALAVSLPDRGLLGKFAQLSVISVMASPFGYASLKFIDYPTMILGKSCKLVPVLLMNAVLYGRRFPLHRYAIAALVTAGVSAFMLLHPRSDDARARDDRKRAERTVLQSLWGLALLAVNLLLDGITNSTQDRIFHTARGTLKGPHMMLYMNVGATILTLSYMFATEAASATGALGTGGTAGELRAAVAFCAAHPRALADLLAFAACGALGQCFIFHALERFGAVTVVTVTVTRKMFSILLSVFLYDHRLVPAQWLAVAAVFAGIALEAFWKPSSASTAAAPATSAKTKVADAKPDTASGTDHDASDDMILDRRRTANSTVSKPGELGSQEESRSKAGHQARHRRRKAGKSGRED
ncbi:UDP-galactose transporter [Cladochytrium tenue]|nr:UDP-galactose transporter [Cladochytrium tenue]